MTIWDRRQRQRHPCRGLTGVTNTGDVVIQVDTNNDGTNVVSFVNGVVLEVAQLNESGNLQIDGTLTVGGASVSVGALTLANVSAGALSLRGQSSCDVRLTLTSATPVTTTDVTAATSGLCHALRAWRGPGVLHVLRRHDGTGTACP